MSRPTRWAPIALAWLLVLLAAALTGQALWAAQLQIEAPRFTFDQATHTYTYEDGRLTLGDLSLFASHMVLNTATGAVHATGFIRVQTPQLSGIAEALDLDANTRVGTLHGASLHLTQGGLYLRAESVVVQPDGGLVLQSCTLTSCPPGVPGAWHIAASSVHLRSEGLGVAWNPRLSLGPVPILWLPGIAWPTVNERRSGLLIPQLSNDSSSLKRFNLGWRLSLPVFLNLGYDHDLTLTPEVIQNRGTALGLEYNYAFWPDERGRLTLWGLKERDPRDAAQENVPSDITALSSQLTRYRADWLHNQGLGDATRLVLGYHDSSDGQVRREYDAVTEYRPYRTYQASLTTQWPWADAALTFEQNADFTDESVFARGAAATDLRQRPQLLPRLTTHLGGRPLGGLPLALGLNLGATRFEAPDAVSGRLYEASPTLALPLALGGAFELRSSFTRHLVSYAGLTQGSGGGGATPLDAQSFGQTEGRVELRTALARVYTPESGAYAALKHRIVPRLIFTDVQDVPQPFADQVLRGRVAERLVTLRLDNDLLGRGPDPALPADAPPGTPAPLAPVTDLLHVNLIQRYNLLLRPDAPTLQGPALSLRQETEPGQPLLPLLLEVTAQGSQFSANALVNYHHQLHRTTQMALGLQGITAPGTTLGVGYSSNEFAFVTPDNKEVAAGNAFTFNGAMAWTDNWGMGFSGRINLVDGTPPLNRRLDQGELFVEYHPVCYRVRASYTEQVATTLEAGVATYYLDRRFKLSFDLTGLVGGAAPPPSTSTPSTTADADASPQAHCRS